MPLPSMPISLSAGGGGPATSGSNAGVQTPISNPFNFDGSGFVVNFGGSNKTNAGGNSDANATSQTGSPGGVSGALAGMDPMMLMLGGVVLLVLMRRR